MELEQIEEGSQALLWDGPIRIIQNNPLKTNSVKSHLCFRRDGSYVGSYVQMEGHAMVFQSELTEADEGLYTCQASFYHHTATVNILVEVMSKDRQFGENLPTLLILCFPSALRPACLPKTIRSYQHADVGFLFQNEKTCLIFVALTILLSVCFSTCGHYLHVFGLCHDPHPRRHPLGVLVS